MVETGPHRMASPAAPALMGTSQTVEPDEGFPQVDAARSSSISTSRSIGLDRLASVGHPSIARQVRPLRSQRPAFWLGTFVGLLSLDGILLEANRMALAAADPNADEALGRPFWEATWWSWNPAVQGRLRDAVQRAASGEVIRYDETVKIGDGGLIAIDFTIVPLVEHGRVTALVSSAIDVTERQLAENRTKALAVFTRRLAAASNVRQIVTLVAESGPAVLHAATCRVSLWDRDRGLLTVPEGDPGPEAVGDPPSGRGIRTPAEDAVRTATTIVVADTAARHDYPHLTASWAAGATLAMAATPLQTAPGSVLGRALDDVLGNVLGAMDVTWTAPVSLDSAQVASLDTMADICGQALQRALLHDAQGALVQALQHELLPGLPAVSGLDLAARYLPASDQLAFGGDWYDAVPLSCTTTAVVVGDVVGHGVHAAARMARVRGVLDALIQLDADPGTLFRRAHHLLLTLDDPFIGTAALFLIDTANDMLTYARAGHPPALLRTPDGDVLALTGGHAPALGIPTQDVDPGLVPFGSGSVLLAYTDGLVERRDQDLDTGIENLGRELRNALMGSHDRGSHDLGHVMPADLVLGRVVDAVAAGAHRRDDIAAVLISRH